MDAPITRQYFSMLAQPSLSPQAQTDIARKRDRLPFRLVVGGKEGATGEDELSGFPAERSEG
jgi:hypothetical protein